MLIKLYYSTNLLHRSCQISSSDTHNTLLCYVAEEVPWLLTMVYFGTCVIYQVQLEL